MTIKMTTEQALTKAHSAARIKGGSVLGFVGGAYTCQRDKLKLSCSCGNVWSTTSFLGLMNGNWCPLCGGTVPPSQDSAHERAKKFAELKGGSFLGFVGGSYVNAKTKVSLKCSDGHEWSSCRFDKLVSGERWCPVCAKTGFNVGKPGYLYALVSEDGSKVKVGITNDIKRRFEYLRQRTPFRFDVLFTIFTTGKRAHRMEKYFHDSYDRVVHQERFDGSTEWLRYSPELINDLESAR